jgi:hypothetical protein
MGAIAGWPAGAIYNTHIAIDEIVGHAQSSIA